MGFVNKISTNLPSTVLAVGELGVARLTGKLYVGDGTSSGDSANTVVNASKADKLSTARTIALTGDVTYTSGGFDGSGNVTGAATLANSGVTAGIYRSVTVDAKGRVTSGTNPTTLSEYGITELLGAIGNINAPLLDMPLKNSLAMKAGVGSATFTRASTATYIDRYGVLKTAAINEARFESEGYLNEGASTNLCTYSSDFSNASYAKIAVTVTAATTDVLGLDGLTYDYNKIQSTAFTGYQYLAKSITATAGTAYTHQMLIKKGNWDYVRVDIGNATDGFYNYVTINFSTKSIVTSAGKYTVRWLPKGECILAVTITTTVTDCSARLFFCNSNGNPLNFAGTGAEYVYASHCQVEALPFASSYIPTTTAAVTRAADNLTLPTSGNYNLPADKKTIILDYDILGYGTVNQTLFDLNGTSQFNRILSFNPSAPAPAERAGCYYSGSFAVFSATAMEANTKHRLAYLLPSGTATQSVTRYFNRVFYASTSQTLTANVAPTILCIGRNNSILTNNHFGHISNVRVYDKALSATEIALA